MTQVWVYALRSSKAPNWVNCVVPWRVDDELIYFGPCKARIRERLRRSYLREDCHFTEVRDDLYIVGVNGSNNERIRKVVWAGKLQQAMTFAEADRRLIGSRFQELREAQFSPLHVQPIDDEGSLVGYRHRSEEHVEDHGWVVDLTSQYDLVRVKGRMMTLRRGATAWDVLDRDCCMVLQNRFFARGQGIDIDHEVLQILREAQPSKKFDIGPYAVFGLARNGTANGLRGTYLTIDGELADRFVKWLDDRADEIASQSMSNDPLHTCDRRVQIRCDQT